MKCLVFFALYLNLLSSQLQNKLIDIKVYNIHSEEEIRDCFKSFKINRVEKVNKGYKLEVETSQENNLNKKIAKNKKKVTNKKVYLDYLWVLILPFFILLYFALTKVAEKLLFMPFDPYEKYKNSLNFLLKKNKKNKYKIFLILQYFKNYLNEKIGLDYNCSNEELVTKFEKLGLGSNNINEILCKVNEIKHPSYNLKDEDLNELLESLESIILKIEQKYEE